MNEELTPAPIQDCAALTSAVDVNSNSLKHNTNVTSMGT